MLKHARNHHRIHNMYNLPYQSEPGSDMAKVCTRAPAAKGLCNFLFVSVNNRPGLIL